MIRKVFGLVCCILCLSSQASNDAKVLLLNSYHPQYAWTDQLTQGVIEALSAKIPDENLHIEYMDARRFIDDPRFNKLLIDLFEHKYRQYSPDVIITSDDHAFYFLMEHGEALFPGVPIIFCGVNVFSSSRVGNKTNVTGIKEGMDIEGNLELITQLQPRLKRIILLGDSTGQGFGMVNYAKSIKAQWEYNNKGVKLEIWDKFALKDLYRVVQDLTVEDALLILAIHKDLDGNYFSYDKELPILTGYSKAPVYGMWGSLMIGRGAMGGMMNNPKEHGASAAKLALKILNGTPVSQLPIQEKALYKPYFDYEQLQRFDIPVTRVPEASMIVGQPRSTYQDHKALINAVLVVITVLLILIAMLYINIRKRAAAQQALNTLNQELENKVIERTFDLSLRNAELEQAYTKFEQLAKTDALTGMANRYAANQDLAAFHQRVSFEFDHFCLAVLDVDFFKNINDRYGHQTGDLVLQFVAKWLTDSVRPKDSVYRWGGEEFLIVLPDTDEAQAMQACSRIRQLIESSEIDSMNEPKETFYITVSIGISGFHRGDSLDALLARADHALYQAKEQGRNRVLTFKET